MRKRRTSKYETLFFKNVEWLRPYFELCHKLVPLNKVKIVKGYIVSYKVGSHTSEAACHTYNHRAFRITLMTHQQHFKRNSNGTFSPKRHGIRTIYILLGDFAHELAHVVHWEHTPEHWELECKIQQLFIRRLKRLGAEDVAVYKAPE